MSQSPCSSVISRSRWQRLGLSCAVVAIAACSAVPGLSGLFGSDYYPIVQGATWNYDVLVKDSAIGTAQAIMSDVDQVGSAQQCTLRITVVTSSDGKKTEAVGEVKVRKDSASVSNASGSQGQVVWLNLPPVVGDKWEVSVSSESEAGTGTAVVPKQTSVSGTTGKIASSIPVMTGATSAPSDMVRGGVSGSIGGSGLAPLSGIVSPSPASSAYSVNPGHHVQAIMTLSKTMAGFEEVTVGSGTYRAARIETTAGTKFISKAWYAPGVGTVREVAYNSDGSEGRELRLTSFTM